LCAALVERGDAVVALSRSSGRASQVLGARVEIIEGDPTDAGRWQAALDGCTAVVNLAGEPIAGHRWNAQYRQKLLDSRVDCTRHVVEAIESATVRPRVLVSASGVDYYAVATDIPGESEDEADVFDEQSPRGDGFLARLCRDWEDEALRAEPLGVHVVTARLGVVLAKSGGALPRMARPFKLFVGGRVADGKQFLSWVHIDDAVGAMLFAIDGNIEGPINVVADSVRQASFASALAHALHRPSWLPVPKFALRTGVGPLAEYLISGRQVAPTALRAAGYTFRYPELSDALAAIYG
jgi:uncharacterized protein (TIGR01777 family)